MFVGILHNKMNQELSIVCLQKIFGNGITNSLRQLPANESYCPKSNTKQSNTKNENRVQRIHLRNRNSCGENL